jgi:hypothetical protein
MNKNQAKQEDGPLGVIGCLQISLGGAKRREPTK